MINHIVMWKLQPGISETERQLAAKTIKSTLESLDQIIEQIIQIHVGINIENPHANFDIVLNAQFHSMADLADYQAHLEHLAAGKAIKHLLTDRACVDYEL